MNSLNYKPLIIATRSRALFAVCFAIFCATVEFWDVLIVHSNGQTNWFVPFNSAVSGSGAATLNAIISAALLYALVQVCRYCRRGERIFFAVCFGEVLLIPIKTVVPMGAIPATVWAQAFGTLVLIAAAVLVFRGLPVRNRIKAAATA
jgi:hypothetical protein